MVPWVSQLFINLLSKISEPFTWETKIRLSEKGDLQTISNKIVETLYSNRVTSGNKRIHTPPCPLHSKLGCLLFSIGSSNSVTTLHGGMGVENLYFRLLKTVKRQKAPFGHSVSTNLFIYYFVADCSRIPLPQCKGHPPTQANFSTDEHFGSGQLVVGDKQSEHARALLAGARASPFFIYKHSWKFTFCSKICMNSLFIPEDFLTNF